METSNQKEGWRSTALIEESAKRASSEEHMPTCRACGKKHWPFRLCEAKRKNHTNQPEEKPVAESSKSTATLYSQGFAPTCKLCQKPHWPLDPSCIGKKGARAEAKALKKAKAKAKAVAKAEAKGKAEERAFARIWVRAEGMKENTRQTASIRAHSADAVAEIKTPYEQAPAAGPKAPEKDKPHAPKPAAKLNNEPNDSGKMSSDRSARIQNPTANLASPVLTMRAKDVMQKRVVWADPDSSVRKALTKMQHNTPCIIVGRSGILEGILTPADLAGAVSPYLRPEFAKWRRPQDDATLQIKIKWIMTRPVQAVAPDTPLPEVAEIMRSLNRCALPVTDEKGKVHGLVTTFDILGANLSPNSTPTADLAASKKDPHTPPINIHTCSPPKPAKMTVCN